LDFPEGYGQAFNLASGRSHQIRSILASLTGLSGLQIDVRVDPGRLRRVEVPNALGNAEAAARVFGWRPEIALEKTLSDVLEDWKVRG
jgi:nucleoside-diphosphate-sugar epimerase